MRDVTDLLEITKVSERCPSITVTGYYVMTQHVLLLLKNLITSILYSFL